MAQRKTTAAKKTTARSSAAKKEQTQKALESNAKRRHIYSVILFAAGLLFTAFAFFSGNAAWNTVHRVLKGSFGIAVFVVGPMMIYVSVMISANDGKSSIKAKFIELAVMICLLSGIVQIFLVGETTGNEQAKGIVSYLYDQGKELKGGGLLSIVLAYPLMLLAGRIGAGIIMVLIIFVFIMLISNVTLVQFLKICSYPFKKLGAYIKQKNREYKEEAELIALENSKKNVKQLERDIERDSNFFEIKDQTDKAHGKTNVINTPPSANDLSAPVPNPNPLISEIKEYNKKEGFFSDKNTNLPDDTDTPAEIQPSVKTENTEVPENVQTENMQTVDIPPVSDISGEDIPAQELNIVEENPVINAIADFAKEQNIDVSEITEKAGSNSFYDIDAEGFYTLPQPALLEPFVPGRSGDEISAELDANADKLVETLKSFGVLTKFIGYCRGPSVTRYELQPAPGVKISKITGLVDDISLNLASAGVRIEAPIPNKAAVGIEVPNKTTDVVSFREMIDSAEFASHTSKLAAALGKNISGETIIADIGKMPHVLIAGTTGSGKSVCVNSIIMSILYKSTPEEVRFIMIDPKAVEFMIYNGIPHLLIPVVTDPKKAAGALAWAVTEMLNRYKMFAENNVRDLNGYNALAAGNDDIVKMPQIVIFIDELADLMMAAPGEVEDSICRLAQMARAAGMHLVIATQRPSVNVVTGVIKANIPSRIALKVASQVDSRTILDSAGAERLLGRGDMLYYPVGMPKPTRIQGCWISEKEIDRVVGFIKKAHKLEYNEDVMEEIEKQAELAASKNSKKSSSDNDELDVNDDKLDEAIEAVIEAGQASTSYLQRKLKLGYGRAARIIDIMEQMGVVGPFEGSKPRQVIMTKQEWYERKMNKV